MPGEARGGVHGGSGLLRDLPKIGEIFRTVRKAVTIPFTVKFRMGWNDAQIVCVELARMAEAEGLNGVALHARTREQGYSGQAQWEWIAAVKQAVGIPVIGMEMSSHSRGCGGPGSANGLRRSHDRAGRSRKSPIFRQIAQYTASGNYDRPPADRYHDSRIF